MALVLVLYSLHMNTLFYCLFYFKRHSSYIHLIFLFCLVFYLFLPSNSCFFVKIKFFALPICIWKGNLYPFIFSWFFILTILYYISSECSSYRKFGVCLSLPYFSLVLFPHSRRIFPAYSECVPSISLGSACGTLFFFCLSSDFFFSMCDLMQWQRGDFHCIT